MFFTRAGFFIYKEAVIVNCQPAGLGALLLLKREVILNLFQDLQIGLFAVVFVAVIPEELADKSVRGCFCCFLPSSWKVVVQDLFLSFSRGRKRTKKTSGSVPIKGSNGGSFYNSPCGLKQVKILIRLIRLL
ncbi:MAG TPA: hypothetical protein DCP52_01415 [Elusimicrobia bacterium]|nr:hypothetical protein [Elusimicrobiota bacterium]